MTNTKKQEITDTRALKDENRGKLLLRVYLVLLIVSVVVYLALHWLWPADIKQAIRLEARDKSLASITGAEIVISVTEVDMEIIRAQLSASGQAIKEIEKQALKYQKNQFKKRIKEPFKDEKKQSKNELTGLDRLRMEVTKIPGIDEERVTTLIDKIEGEIDEAKPNFRVLKVYLEDLKDEIAKDKIVGRYFWSTGWLRWLELFFWALFGTLFYALMEIQRELRLQGEFRKRTAGYISMTLRGPFVALLLVFALSTVSLKIVNVDIDLTTAPIYVLIFFAGVLGLFSRVAYRQLELIVKSVFPSAWASTRGRFRIIPPTANVAFGETLLFRPDPKQDVRWDIWPDNLGSIDSAGKYTAPKRPGEPPGAVVGAQVTVRATLKEEPSIVETAKVTLFRFAITGPSEVALGGKPVIYNVKPEQDGGVTWDWSPKLGKLNRETGEYTPPKKEETPEAVPGVEITIKATRKQEPKESVTKKIKLVEGT